MKGAKIYLDNCCFNRPFDDQSQIRIHIQCEIDKGNLQLAWSYILDYENSANPFEFRKTSISEWKNKAFTFVVETERIVEQAKEIKAYGLKAKDALHIACAIDANCVYFITTDDEVISNRSFIGQVEILSPVEMINIMEK